MIKRITRSDTSDSLHGSPARIRSHWRGNLDSSTRSSRVSENSSASTVSTQSHSAIMIFAEILHQQAKPFIEKWHYSNCVPTGHNIFFGWFDDNADLYAVGNYGWGVNPYQESFLSRVTGYTISRENCLELKRLCRREPSIGVELTGFLSVCHKELRKRGIEYIVSFSDPAYGHCGGIYKAASFRHLGKTNAEMHVVDEAGNPVHRRIAYRHAKRNGISIAESRKILGLTPKKTVPKDRWFKVINPRRLKNRKSLCQ